MDIIKIAAVGIITAVCAMLLRDTKSELAVLVTVAGGCIILLMVLDSFLGIFAALKNLMERAGIGGQIFSLLIKIIGIGYITDFSAGLVEETGAKSLADKIVLAGKVVIMVLSLPILIKLFDIIAELVQ
ncbi:MAG: hypothetical protein HFK10_02820 [Clostridia bacterium]|nr:hypothetical protein [Clostridia bacterium]